MVAVVDKAKPLSSLQSKTLRHDQILNREIPGPGSYNVNFLKRGSYKKEVQNFGTLVERKSLMLRDPCKYPFKDPSFKSNPSPAAYNLARSLDGNRSYISELRHSLAGNG